MARHRRATNQVRGFSNKSVYTFDNLSDSRDVRVDITIDLKYPEISV